MTKFKKNTHTRISLADPPMHFDFPERMCMHQSLSLSFSLLADPPMHFDFPERMCMHQSLSLSVHICKNGLDPDQTRMELELCMLLKVRKADAHDKMGFQYIH